MSSYTLQHIVRKPESAPPEGAPLLVLLHGVRSNEQDLMGLAPMLDPRLYVVSARGPLTLGPGAYGWYPVQFLPEGGYRIDEDTAEQSRQKVVRFVGELADSLPIDRSRIFLMGFSQGCIMSLGAALSAPRSFAGVVGMSGRLLDSWRRQIATPEQLKGLPVLVVHGTRDQVIPIEYGREIRDELTKLPVDLTYREYEMAHNVSNQSLADIQRWLVQRLDSITEWRAPGA